MKWLILLAGVAYAQTAVNPDQIRAAPATAWRLVAFDPAGRLTLLDIGPGIELRGSTLVATATITPVLIKARLVRNADGTYPATSGIVTRNGIVQEEGADYTLKGAVMVPAVPWDAADVVLLITAVNVTPVIRGAP